MKLVEVGGCPDGPTKEDEEEGEEAGPNENPFPGTWKELYALVTWGCGGLYWKVNLPHIMEPVSPGTVLDISERTPRNM